MSRKFYVNDIWKNIRSILVTDSALKSHLTNGQVYTSPDFEEVRPDGAKMILAVSPGNTESEEEPDESDQDMYCYLLKAGISGPDVAKTRFCPTEFIIAGKHYVAYSKGVDPEAWIDQVTVHEQRVFEALNNHPTLKDSTKHLGWTVSAVERVDPIGRDVQNGYVEIRFVIVLTVNVIFQKRD